MLTDVGQALDPEGQEEEEEEDHGEKSQKKRENFVHSKSQSKLGEGKTSTQRECTHLKVLTDHSNWDARLGSIDS